MDTLYTFWDNITHYKTESVHIWGAYELSNWALNPKTLNPGHGHDGFPGIGGAGGDVDMALDVPARAPAGTGEGPRQKLERTVLDDLRDPVGRQPGGAGIW